MRIPFLLAAVVLFTSDVAAQRPGDAGTPIGPGEACPPGMTEIRPRRCLAPQLPAPSILDYRPGSTLVVSAHPVPRAKFPAIDFHGHVSSMLATPEGIEQLAAALDNIYVRVVIAADGLSGERLQRTMAAINATPRMKD